MSRIFVTILTCNRLDKLRRLVESIAFRSSLMDSRVNVLVVAQGCTDGTNEYLLNRCKTTNFHVLIEEQNGGIIAGHNMQVNFLVDKLYLRPEDYVIFLDDDVEVLDECWIEKLLRPMRLEPRIAVVGCYAEMIADNWTGFQGKTYNPGPVDVVNQSHTAVGGHVFTLGGFRFDYVLGTCWHEDFDMCMFVQSNGNWVYYVGKPETVGLRHDPHHKVVDMPFLLNFRYVEGKWRGKGIPKCEQGRG